MIAKTNQANDKSTKVVTIIRKGYSERQRIPSNGHLSQDQRETFKQMFLTKYGKLLSKLAYE